MVGGERPAEGLGISDATDDGAHARLVREKRAQDGGGLLDIRVGGGSQLHVCRVNPRLGIRLLQGLHHVRVDFRHLIGGVGADEDAVFLEEDHMWLGAGLRHCLVQRGLDRIRQRAAWIAVVQPDSLREEPCRGLAGLLRACEAIHQCRMCVDDELV